MSVCWEEKENKGLEIGFAGVKGNASTLYNSDRRELGFHISHAYKALKWPVNSMLGNELIGW